MDVSKLVIGLAGMPGSGKSLAVDTARQLGYSIVTMGDVIREETKKRGLDLTPENVGKVMLELRQEDGNFVIARRCIPKIQEIATYKVLVDGLRSLFEAEIFKDTFKKFSLIAIHAAPETRFRRLANRRRSDDTLRREIFCERDKRELSVGIGNVIAMAEELIINENSAEQVKSKIREAVGRIEQKWSK